MANGVLHKVQGAASLPICINKTIRLVETLVVPQLQHFFIFGSDLCFASLLKIEFKGNSWDIRDSNNSELCMIALRA